MGMLISNEPDFMIHGVLKYQLFGQDFWITTTTIGMWIITALILILGGTGEPDPQKGNGPAGNISECAGDGL